MMPEPLVFQLQRFCTHDGPGIRTTVFLKGCPLHCAWCHNPESQGFGQELFYSPTLCLGCGACAEVCPTGAQRLAAGQHVFERSLCRLCLRCSEVCPARALEPVGRELSVEALLGEVERDRVYYEESGGGLTLTGGEPLAHLEFTRALLAEARRRHIHTCLETCGFAPPERVLELRPLVDLFLWDIKDTDPERHLRMTGVPLGPILDNLRRLDEAGGQTWLRCLLVEGVNVTLPHLEALAALYHSLRHCRGVTLLPYHPLGNSKLARLGLDPAPTTFSAPAPATLQAARSRLRDLGVPEGLTERSHQDPD